MTVGQRLQRAYRREPKVEGTVPLAANPPMLPEMSKNDVPPSDRAPERRTKIVCTMGPRTQEEGVLESLVGAGMDCARLNMSHGSHADHLRTAERVRKAAEHAGRPISILADLQGPKIRVGRFPGGPVELLAGEEFTLLGGEGDCSKTEATISYDYLGQDLRPGDRVLMDDGLLELVVLYCENNRVVCRVVFGGTLSDRKGVNLPFAKLRIPGLTEKDKADLAFARDVLHTDFVALSFVRRADDIHQARRLLGTTPIIAKLEKPEAIENLDSILDAADGAMVARGDLGVELGSEKVPMAQKRIIFEANRRGKLVITATQMLDSMIRNPRPTRAEAADVANAILDGTDAIMLSGETASGRYPLEAVQMMHAISLEAEAGLKHQRYLGENPVVEGGWEFPNAAARGAALMTQTLPLAAVVVVTRHGRSAELLSHFRPRAPLVAITSDPRAAQRLALYWGVKPHLELPVHSMDEALLLSSRILREAGNPVGAGYALVTASHPDLRTNTVTLQRIAP